MRVLHLFDTAGVASVISKFMDRGFGSKSEVMRNEGKENPYVFCARAYLYARKFDLVHVHSHQKSVPWLKRLYPKKPVVLTFHGSDIQKTGWDAMGGFWEADAVTVVNHYLLDEYCSPEWTRVILNAPDTDLFKQRKGIGIGAVARKVMADDENRALASRYGLSLDFIDKIPYLQMPETLSRFAFYCDARRSPVTHEIIPAMSKTALEALACGLKVINHEGVVVDSLPEENRPEVQAARYFEIYRGTGI